MLLSTACGYAASSTMETEEHKRVTELSKCRNAAFRAKAKEDGSHPHAAPGISVK